MDCCAVQTYLNSLYIRCTAVKFHNIRYMLVLHWKPKKHLYYSFVCDENLHTYVKLKIKWGECHEFFLYFCIENELFTENVKKGVRGNEPKGQTVQTTQLLLLSFEAEFCAQQNYSEFFFFEIYFSFRVIKFYSKKMHFCPEN